MLKLSLAAAVAAFAVAAQAQDLTAGDATAGEKVFRKCQACHMVGEDAKNRVGPHLNDLIGRTPGAVEDFNYSDAMTEFGASNVWDVPTLAEYLRAPRELVPGTKMAFAGLRKDEEIADVLAYLAQYDAEGLSM